MVGTTSWLVGSAAKRDATKIDRAMIMGGDGGQQEEGQATGGSIDQNDEGMHD